MDITTTIILLLFAIVISNLLDSAFPKLPLPVVQIVFGVLIALAPINTHIELNPQLFMGLMIAPLLFREAEEADVFELWRVRKAVIILVFGLVFLTVFAIGFSVKFLLPGLPLAACFALGAILGPTDAIAVSSVSNSIDIDKRVMNVLRGEWLINDATGVISFNFAVFALTTGAFSLFDASLEFLLLCVGGFAIGFILIMIKNQVSLALKRHGIRSHASFMIIEILMPFICFFVAEALHCSGIIAAVTAGCRQSLRLNRLDIYEAEFSIFKKSLWEIIIVSINSFAFILLGMHLPGIITTTHQSAEYSVTEAFKIALLVTIIMFAVRFVGTLFTSKNVIGTVRREQIRNRFILTFSGVKGAVSLATAFALPVLIGGNVAFVQRDFLLLITTFSILLSLVASIILLPLVAKKKVKKKKNEAHIKVLRELVFRIENDPSGECNKTVVLHHKRRISTLEMEDYKKGERKLYVILRREFLKEEMKEIERRLKAGTINEEEYLLFSDILSLVESMQKGRTLNKHRVRYLLKERHYQKLTLGNENIQQVKHEIGHKRMQDIFWTNTGTIIEILKNNHGKIGEELMAQVVEERVAIASAIMERIYGASANASLHIKYDREVRRSFDLERKILDEFVEKKTITLNDSDHIRKEINLIENYTLEDIHDDVAIKVIRNRSKKIRATLEGKLKEIKNDEDLS